MSNEAGETSAFHADDVLAHAETVLSAYLLDSLDISERRALPVKPVPYNAAIAVPILSTTLVDMRMFGELRRSAIFGDWIAGGLIPVVLSASAMLSDNTSRQGRSVLLYSALGVYLATRVIVCISINHHIATYNRHVRSRVGFDTGRK